MANQQRALVNQRLYFCRLHLSWMQQALEQADVPAHVIEQSLAESVIFHLVTAYRLYLAEVATAYSCPCESLDNTQALMDLLALQQRESAEAREMQQLEQGGWLQELITAFHAILDGRSQSPGKKPAQGIPVLQVAQQALDYDRCEAFLESFHKLIENQRSRLEEW
jgi:hypothetical protein